MLRAILNYLSIYIPIPFLQGGVILRTRELPIVNLEQLLHPLQIHSGAMGALRWETMEGGTEFHRLGELSCSRASRGQSTNPVAGLLASGETSPKVPSLIDGVKLRRGWSIVVPIVGAVSIADQRIEEQHLGVIPPGEDEEVLQLDSHSVVMLFHPGPHACQREGYIRGSLSDVLRPTAVNQRFLRDARRDPWERGVMAYPFDCSSTDSGVDISLLQVPTSGQTEGHRHGSRGEFSLLLGREGRVDVGGEAMRAGDFDLEGPRTTHQLRVLEPCWALQVSLDGTELEEI